MKITENKLRDLIRQEIVELSVQNSKTKVASKVPPKSLPKGTKGMKGSGTGDSNSTQTNLIDCWKDGGVMDTLGNCTKFDSSNPAK